MKIAGRVFQGLMFAWYVGTLVATLSGYPHRIPFSIVLLLWTPIALEYESSGLGNHRGRTRPEVPGRREIIAGVAWAFVSATIFVYTSGEVGAFETVSDLSGFVSSDWPMLLVTASFALMALALVARPAHWVVRWNAERAERLVSTEAALAKARARVLQSQMQPHFLFNALNSVTALLREDPARAKAVLVSLKGLMERSLETSQEPMTSVRKEVAFVRDQLAIELERFHDRLRVSFDVPDSLLNERIPAFSLQPLAENALRHGIAQSIDGGVVAVRVAKEDKDLVLSVENTGAELSPGWREGTGLGNLRARLDARYGRNAQLSITQTGDRTRAAIRISHEPFTPLLSSKRPEVITA